MGQVKSVSGVLATVLTLGAVAATTASAALPEFEGPFPKHFVATQLGAGFLETVGGNTVECSGGSTALGFIRSEKDLLVSGGIAIRGCGGAGFGQGKCQTGATEGEIITLQVLGLLGYINKAAKEVGVLFEPDNAPDFTTFKCKTILGEETLLIKGTIVCPLSPVNTETESYKLICSQTKGVQKPLGFEGGTGDTLMIEGKGPKPFAFEQAGIQTTFDVLTLGQAKINA
jgi:hypothetical protein